MNMTYTNKGICIFCDKSAPEVTFENKPHLLPRSMGGNVIGVDICDDCNHYFGTIDALIPTPPKLAVEVCVKEVMNISQHFFLNRGKQKQKLKSFLFNYYDSKRKLEYKNKNWKTKNFQLFFARQFKRGLFEIFLQTYHYKTGNGLDSKFDSIRRFARFNEGNAKLFYGLNRGLYLIGKEYMEHPFFPMTDSCIDEIENYGFYTLYLNGHLFFLEVVPKTEMDRNTYLNKLCKEHRIGGSIYVNLQEIIYIDQIDFTLRSLFATTHQI